MNIRMYSATVIMVMLFSSLKLTGTEKEMEHREMKTNSVGLPEWAKNANIYEVNIRQYTPEGTFNAFRKHLGRLKEMGVDILWFMPIYPISEKKKKGSLGSYYAVSDFRTTNPKFGTIEEFDQIVNEAHDLGMKVILDWVPNHTGWDHYWLEKYPDFYTHDKEGNIISPLNEKGESMGWDDVADLNYDNQLMRQTMVQDMLFWLKGHSIDGFRNDMAMLVPLDFWEDTAQKLRAVNPDIFMLAESEVHDHIIYDCFNSIYAWTLHHILNDIAKGKKNASSIDQWMLTEQPKVKQGLYMQFTSNHDENSHAGSEIERMGEAHKAFAVLVNTIEGIPLTYSGQEEPLPRRLEFFEKDDIGFKNYAYGPFYQKLNNLRHRNEALWLGNYGGPLNRILKNEEVFAFTREKGSYKVTVIINLSKQRQALVSDTEISGAEIFTGKSVKIGIGDKIELMPWEYMVLE